jgi:hypothetical protein
MASIYRLRLTPEPVQHPAAVLPLRPELGGVQPVQYKVLRTRLSRRPRRQPAPVAGHHSVGDYLKYLYEA